VNFGCQRFQARLARFGLAGLYHNIDYEDQQWEDADMLTDGQKPAAQYQATMAALRTISMMITQLRGQFPTTSPERFIETHNEVKTNQVAAEPSAFELWVAR
jgi:hypothetical protein